MKDQINTIREGIKSALEAEVFVDKPVRRALLDAVKAAAQLEAMVGEQEPVHWRAVLDPEQAPHQLKTTMHVVGFREKKAAEGFVAEQIDFYGWRYTIEPLYAAPVAQQYEAGDVASASAQGFRDGVASVAQQPTFDARRALEAIEALLSNIRRDAPSLSGKVMGFAEEVAAALRDKVAQQPDFADAYQGAMREVASIRGRDTPRKQRSLTVQASRRSRQRRDKRQPWPDQEDSNQSRSATTTNPNPKGLVP